MPKRKTQISDAEGEEGDNFSPQEVVSDDSDYESAPKATKRRRIAPNSRTSNRKSKGKARQDSALAVEDTPDIGCIELRHEKSFHAVGFSHEILVALLHWFRGVSTNRGMPWRKAYDPSFTISQRSQRAYEVWVSEIMLQQTRVATVIPYYNAWMEKFPTMDVLASSTIDEVNASWKGLGYYSRAARLLAGSQKVVSEYGGIFPGTAKDMEKSIPGIGRYTAGAISSIAYGEQVPVLDGNVHRLLSRFLAIYASPKAKATLDVLWNAADALVKGTDCIASCKKEDDHVSIHPGDVNQALIELGSTVCRDREPDCTICPLRPWCNAYNMQTNLNNSEAESEVPDIEDLCNVCEPLPRTPDVSLYPMRIEKKKPREELDLVSVIEWRPRATAVEDRQFLLVRRPEGGLLAGLMEFPTIPCVDSEGTSSKADTTKRGQIHVADLFGSPDSKSTYEVNKILRLPKDIVHIFSHIKKTYRVQWILLSGGIAPPPILVDDETALTPVKANEKQKPRQKKSRYFAGTETASRQTSWIPIDQVNNANIGTGVSKIWAATQKLWQ